jgi:hypothetical protein
MRTRADIALIDGMSAANHTVQAKKKRPEGRLWRNAALFRQPRGSPLSLTVNVGPGGALIWT